MSDDKYTMSCDRCGKEMEDGEQAYGLTSGFVSAEMEGFNEDTMEPWIESMCQECWDKVSLVLWPALKS